MGPTDLEGFKWGEVCLFSHMYAQVVHFTWNMSSIPESFDLFHPLFMISMSCRRKQLSMVCTSSPSRAWEKDNTEARAQQVSKQPVP